MRLTGLLIILLSLIFLASCKTTEPYSEYKSRSDKQIFEQAENHLARGNSEVAIKDFEALDVLYPFGEYSQQGQLDIIFAYYKHGDTDEALAAADRYIRLYPRATDVDYAYYMKGLINLGPPEGWMERWLRAEKAQLDVSGLEQAFADFNVLIERFPVSKYVPDARSRMLYIRNLLAQHQLELSRYYLERKIYVAAANRASEVVDHYPSAPQVIPALGVMVEAYRALGQEKMANDALQVLQSNYGGTKEGKALLKKLGNSTR